MKGGGGKKSRYAPSLLRVFPGYISSIKYDILNLFRHFVLGEDVEKALSEIW